MESTNNDCPKVNIFALPNQTTIIFVLIVTVIAGTLIMGYAITAAPIVWMFAFVLVVLPLRAFIARPEREFSRYNCSESVEEFADLQKEIDSCALKMGLSRSPKLIVRHEPNIIFTFGTFRHWFVVIDKDHADICKARLNESETAPIVQAELIHELSHFKAGDYWQLGYVTELLRITGFFMLWAFAYLLGYGILLSVLKTLMIQSDLTEWIKQSPVMLQGMLQTFNIMGMMELFRQTLAKADLPQLLLFYVGVT